MLFGAVGMSKNFKLFLTLIFGFLIGLSLKRVYEANVFHAWTWPSPPIVVNCYGKVLPEIVVVRAVVYSVFVAWWLALLFLLLLCLLLLFGGESIIKNNNNKMLC